jgi:hypothetical protein
MKKPEKNQKRKLAKIKRGVKRSQRLKDSREIIASRRKQASLEKALKQKKMDELMDKILQSRFNQ